MSPYTFETVGEATDIHKYRVYEHTSANFRIEVVEIKR